MTTVRTKNLAGIGEIRYYKRKGMRSITLSLRPDHVRVSLPKSTPYYLADKFVLQKRDWILQHQVKQPTLGDGDGIGKKHILRVETGRQKSFIKDGVIYTPDKPASIKKAINRALKLECQQLLTPMLETLSATSGLLYNSVAYQPMTSRWGSCSSKGKITINSLLIQLPWDVIEYVLVHELSHTIHMNHGSAFWLLVQEHCPDYKQRRKTLRAYSPQHYTLDS